MEGQGAFPSDQTYRILALRSWLFFKDTATQAGLTDWDFYHRAEYQIFWKLVVAAKNVFEAPCWYLPAAGGLFGDLGTSTDVYFVNGVPSSESLMKLARSIAIPARQNFYVECSIAAMGNSNLVTDFAALTAGEVSIGYMIDGLHVRDVL